jgi:hypothetical protein
MGDITGTNAVVTITIPGVFSAPQTLQGFDVDGVIDNDAVDTAETKMGVDGKKSAGFVFAIVPTTIHLQADSQSLGIFETWLQAMKTATQDFPCSMSIVQPAIGRKYTLTNGTMKRPKQMADIHKVLQARAFVIDWEDISPANI